MDSRYSITIHSDKLVIDFGAIPIPELHSHNVHIVNEGELRRGVYRYALTCVQGDIESGYINEVVINAPYPYNSIILSWDASIVPIEYRLYKGLDGEAFDGFFSLPHTSNYFCDDGRGIPNQLSIHPSIKTSGPFTLSIHTRELYKYDIDNITCAGRRIIIKLKSGKEFVLDHDRMISGNGAYVGWPTALLVRFLNEWLCL